MVMVREAIPEDWQALRDARLAGLREAPHAFASAAERESAYSEQKWRAWTQVSGHGVMYLAEVPGQPEPAGIAGVLDADGEAHLISMWVRPAVRGQKVGEALIEATAEWARSRGFDSIYLWVTESNASARRLYERCGFTGTGERQPLPSDPALPEIKMSRLL
jgi:ribosomal protein S18 acetylase RimI-like enzyme